MSKRGKKNWGKSLTVTEPSHNGNIADAVNRLVRGESITGNGRQPLPAGDYSAVPALDKAMTITRRATESFEALPSVVRDKFANDPMRLNQFLLSEDKNDIEQSYLLGLRIRPVSAPNSADNKPAAKSNSAGDSKTDNASGSVDSES